MSTIKSSAENLTLNADGANNDIKFQSNGSEVASIDQAGLISAGGVIADGAVNSTYFTGGSSSVAGRQLTLSSEDGTGGNDNATHRLTVPSGYGSFAVSVAGSERIRIPSTGGITFNGDTAAANALDDYEEGNFTTTFIVGGNAITASYTSQHVASYIKVGKMVTCFVQTNTSSISGTISGNVELTGLPFAKGGNGAAGSHCGDAYHFANNHPIAYTINSTSIGLNRPDANKTAIVAADLRTSGDSNQLFLSFSYRTA